MKDSKIESYDIKGKKYREKLTKSHTKVSFESREEGNIHGTYEFENTMLSYIRDGEVRKLKDLLSNYSGVQDFNQGKLASDPLRQAKNLLIGFTAMVGKVAGIPGGMDIEDAYYLIDLYTQETENCSSPEEVYLLQYTMVMDFTEKVADLRTPPGISKDIHQAMQYIQNNTNRNISLDDVADHINKSRSYLTKNFRTQTGRSVSQFITETKIRDAKRLLRYSKRSIPSIANHLCFSSQSYFQIIFKKNTGTTPGEYRRKYSNY